jgi:hypothetical protein
MTILTGDGVAVLSAINIEARGRPRMARQHRITVRLEETELAAIEGFADRRPVIPSVAVRWLISMGLGADRARQCNCHTKHGGHDK